MRCNRYGVKAQHADDGAARLMVAIVLRAVADARHGDGDAVAWLEEFAPELQRRWKGNAPTTDAPTTPT